MNKIKNGRKPNYIFLVKTILAEKLSVFTFFYLCNINNTYNNKK